MPCTRLCKVIKDVDCREDCAVFYAMRDTVL
jgi:hypothetical protein